MNLPPSILRGGRFLRARALWAVAFAIVATALRLGHPAPPPRSAEGVAAMLGDAVGGEVRPDDFVWEERGGAASDGLFGRRVLFLARVRDPRGGEPAADLFRARVRLTRAGRPISLGGVHNLSRSSLGDEGDLLARGRHAAFTTRAAGVVQGITLLDLAGEGPAREATGRWERLGASIEAWLGTGSPDGIGRVEVTFGTLPPEARAELTSDLLVMALGREGVPIALDLRAISLNTGGRDPFAARVQRIPHLARPLGAVVVDTVTALAGEGPGRVAGALTALGRRAPAPRAAPTVFPGREPPPPTAPVDDWPPPPVKPALSPALPGEGIWGAAPAEWVAHPEGELPPIYETALRPGSRHPDRLVRLVAIDSRRLDLRLQPGVLEPRSPLGIHGHGRLPEGPSAAPVVAAFLAAPPENDAISPGFAAEHRVLAPLADGAATVVAAGDGHLAFGAWARGIELPTSVEGLLQTADPLVGGEGQPARIALAHGDAPMDRAGLGLLASGHVIYAWGAGIDAAELGAALRAAGCIYAVHLGAGPARAGFSYLRPPAANGEAWQGRALDAAMSLGPESLTRGAPTGFFRVLRRSVAPRAQAAWAPDPGRQPSPAWIPAIHAASSSNLGAQVHLTTFAPGRMTWRLRVGAKEPAIKVAAALPSALPDLEQGKVLVAIGVGFARKKGARGLGIEGTTGYPFRGEASGVLVLDKGRPAILPAAGFVLPPGADATELPLTADEGKLRPEAREVGSMRPRASACVMDDGSLIVASTTFDSDEAATQALLDAGCARVVALDRGAHAQGFTVRAGAEASPIPRYDPTVLFGLDRPMPGRARRLDDE